MYFFLKKIQLLFGGVKHKTHFFMRHKATIIMTTPAQNIIQQQNISLHTPSFKVTWDAQNTLFLLRELFIFLLFELELL